MNEEMPDWNAETVHVVHEALQRNEFVSLKHVLRQTPEGLLDLRGIPLNLTVDCRLHGVRIQDADFSKASMGWMLLEECSFENCVFTEAKFKKWYDRANYFKNVRFRKVKFYDALIGLQCSVYDHVDFYRTSFAGAHFVSPQFIACDFSYATAFGNFDASNFIDCKFKGKVRSTWFNKYYFFPNDEKRLGKAPFNEMRNVDFTEASLWNVMFTGGVDLSTVKLPKDGLHVLIHRLDRVLEAIAGTLDEIPPPDRETIKRWVDIYRLRAEKGQKMYIINKADLQQDMGTSAANLFVQLVERFDQNE